LGRGKNSPLPVPLPRKRGEEIKNREGWGEVKTPLSLTLSRVNGERG